MVPPPFLFAPTSHVKLKSKPTRRHLGPYARAHVPADKSFGLWFDPAGYFGGLGRGPVATAGDILDFI